MGDLDDLVKEFLIESHENLDRLDREFVQLETDPGNRQILASIFRTIHTVKGTSGFFGFEKLQKLTHVGENLLAKLRDGQLELNAQRSDGLLRMVDKVREILAAIEAGGGEGAGDYSALAAELAALTDGDPSTVAVTAQTVASPAAPAAPVPAAPAPAATVIPTAMAAAQAEPPAAAAADSQSQAQALTRRQMAHEHAAPAGTQRAEGGAPTMSVENAVADSTVRIDVDLLDRLMNLVGELVLARNQVLSHSARAADPALSATTQRLNLITSELQEGIMKTRMQPISNVWNRLPRVVRDLARDCGRQVQVDMEGKETELDRTVIEAIKDPMVHLVRNAVDHGIEPPEVRARAGKPPQGRLLLKAYHESGQVMIEITDDGKGIDPERVKSKAVEKGLVTPEHAARMTVREAVNMVFAPGFSTAEKVTNISGRGVGMDVVKTNIERIGGAVDLITQVGKGSTVKVRIPLTLAIIPALVVVSGGQRFAIPQAHLVEVVRIEADKAATAIENVYGAEVYRLRGQLLPIVHLDRELGLQAEPRDSTTVVVLQADERQFGLVVDGVRDSGEIVVKPLARQLKAINVYAGATIMGDGRVALILDVAGLGTRAHALSKERERHAAKTEQQAAAGQRQALLVFKSPDDGRMAVPLERVQRLEELDRAQVERAGDTDVVQYRGDILSLVYVFQILPERRRAPRNPEAGVPPDKLSVVVHTAANGRSVGLVVGEIVDTVEVDMAQRKPASRQGISACVVVSSKVTEILDLESVVKTALPDFYAAPAQP